MIHNDNRIGALSIFTVPPLLEQLLSGFKHIDFISFIYCSKEVLAASNGSPKLKGRARCLAVIQEYLSFKQKEAGEDQSKLDILQNSVIHYQIEFGMLNVAYRKIQNLPVSIPTINILVFLAKAFTFEDEPLVVKKLLKEAAAIAIELPTEPPSQISMSSGARIDLANMLSREDLLDEAHLVLRPLSDKYRTSNYTAKVEQLIEAGDFVDAIERAKMVSDRLMKCRMLFRIAEAQLKAGHEAYSTYRAAINAATWLTIGEHLEFAASRILFAPTQYVLAFLNNRTVEENITSLIRIAEELGRKEFHEKATPLFTRALELINTIEDEMKKNVHIRSLVHSQVRVGHLESALAVSYQFSRFDLQISVAAELISRGEFDQALTILEKNRLTNYYRIFISIAQTQFRLKKHDEALVTLAKATAIDPTQTIEILMLTARIQAAAGHVDEAFKTMNKINVEYKPQLIKDLFAIYK